MKQGLPQLQVCSQSSVLLLRWKLGVPRAARGWKVGDFQLCVCAGEGQEEAVRVNVSKERMLERWPCVLLGGGGYAGGDQEGDLGLTKQSQVLLGCQHAA